MKVTPKQIDALLPQTQCRECGYSGCLPYAQALAQHQTTIDRCRPGGVNTLNALADLLEQEAAPFVAAMQAHDKPPQTAIIREQDCIGCTKCIQACPVDAIVGSQKQMHTVISQDCTGCGLCVAPCPVDCIDLVTTSPAMLPTPHRARSRFQRREQRLARLQRLTQHQAQKSNVSAIDDKKTYIEQAIERAKLARLNKGSSNERQDD